MGVHKIDMVAFTITMIVFSLQLLLLLLQGTTVGETTAAVTTEQGTTAAPTTAEGICTFIMRNSSALFSQNVGITTDINTSNIIKRDNF